MRQPPLPTFDHIRYRPLPHAVRMHAALDPSLGRPLRKAALIGGYGCGKTYSGAHEAIRQAIYNAPIPFLCISPTFPQARDTTFATVKGILDENGILYDAWFHARHAIEILGTRRQRPDGKWEVRKFASRLQRPQLIWFSATDPGSMKGINACGAWVDEPGLITSSSTGGEDLMGVIEARLRGNDPSRPGYGSHRLLLTGTPETDPWLPEYVEAESKRAERPLVWIKAWTENNKYLPPEFVADLKRKYPPKVAMRYLYGEFVDLLSGGAYDYDADRNMAPVEYDPTLPLYITMDFNRTPAFHALLAQLHGDRSDPNSYLAIIEEIVFPEGNTQRAAQLFKERIAFYRHNQGVTLFGDPAGNKHTTNSTYTDVEILRGEMAMHHCDMEWREVHWAVTRSVDNLNIALCAGRIKINPRCVVLLNDLRCVKWKTGSHYPALQLDTRDPKLTHASDALRYMNEMVYPVAPSGKYRPSVIGAKRPSTHME